MHSNGSSVSYGMSDHSLTPWEVNAIQCVYGWLYNSASIANEEDGNTIHLSYIPLSCIFYLSDWCLILIVHSALNDIFEWDVREIRKVHLPCSHATQIDISKNPPLTLLYRPLFVCLAFFVCLFVSCFGTESQAVLTSVDSSDFYKEYLLLYNPHAFDPIRRVWEVGDRGLAWGRTSGLLTVLLSVSSTVVFFSDACRCSSRCLQD